MQSVRSRIWTRVAVSISCDDNHYTTVTFYIYFIRINKKIKIGFSTLSKGLRKNLIHVGIVSFV